jgi:2-(1,2-epoxy-1,2-dihydrophenyl)acetyl-CoA isomerase
MPTAAGQTVAIHRRDGAAIVELDRPESLNAFNVALTADLLAALQELAADPTVRAIGLTGAGRAFSSGADLVDTEGREHEVTADGRPDLRRALQERYAPITLLLREVPKPVVAIVNGPCAGVGLGFALACDFVLAAESAYFLLAFVNIGLVPDGGASIFVPARVGTTRATQFAMLGERVAAPTALEWGLVNEVHPDAELRPAAEALLDRLAQGPTQAYAGIKRLTNNRDFPRLREELGLEADVQQEMAGTQDFVAGVTAFATKQRPQFTGT